LASLFINIFFVKRGRTIITVIKDELQLPFFAKASIFFVGLVAFVAILYIAQGIIVPLVLSIILAILLHPVVNFFVRIKVNRILAIVLTLILTSMILAAFFILIFSQASQFGESWPKLVDKFTEMLNQLISEIATYLELKPQIIHDWIIKTKDELLHFSNEAIGQTIVSVGNGLMIMLLIPVYIFLILFYHPLLIEFIHRLFISHDNKKVTEIVSQVKTVIQRYLVGLVIEAILVATMNATALIILGIEYAILLGILGAVLNVIPYIGGLVAVALPMIVALATKSTAWYAFYVLGAYYFIQLIDNNALFSIIVVFVGNAIWGITGMFLSIPLLAILKLLFDHIDSLKPWGYLLGDSMPSILTIKPILNKLKKLAP
jgi:predicted PurR-regulated permease PerM